MGRELSLPRRRKPWISGYAHHEIPRYWVLYWLGWYISVNANKNRNG